MRFHGTITVSNTDHDDFTRNRTKVVASYRCPVAGCGSSFESIQVGPDEEMADMIDGLDRRAAKYAADHRDHHDTDKGPYAGPWKTHAEAAAPGRPMGDTKAQTGGEWRTPQGIPTPEDAALFDRGTEYGTKPVEVSFLVHATPDEMALLPTPRRNGKRGKRGPVGPQGPVGPKGDTGLPPAPDEVYNAVARWFEEHPHRIYTNPELMGFFVTPEAQASNTDVTPESVAEAANPQVANPFRDDGDTPPVTDPDRQRQLRALVKAHQLQPRQWVEYDNLAEAWVGSQSSLNKTLHAMVADGTLEQSNSHGKMYRLA